ncbi:MAG: DUF4974 domain-containing protein [Bacteroidia bacterium]|nr:DUF4974 domain-containing protein [Bacteroidia bacterium]
MNPLHQKNYASYKAIDFAKDAYFIHWHLSYDPDAELFWMQLQKQHPHLKAEMERGVEIMRSIRLNPNDLSSEEEIVELNRLQKRIKRHQKTSNLYRLFYVSAAAACLIVAFFLSQLFITNTPFPSNLAETSKTIQLINRHETLVLSANADITFQPNGMIILTDGTRRLTVSRDKKEKNRLIVPKGKRATLTLSDGTRIRINSASEVAFPTLFAKSKREIEVSGEAYLEVAKDAKRPFTVKNPALEVEVLGTKFNFSAYPKESIQEVVLLEGSVKIKSDKKRSLILKPNQMATVTANQIIASEVNATDYINWTDQVLTLESRPLAEVLHYLERYYDVDIRLSPATQALKCNGKLILTDSIDAVLECLKTTMPIDISKESDQIKVSLTTK